MTLQIELTQEQEARLTAAARREGLPPEELARKLLSDQLPNPTAIHGDAPRLRLREDDRIARVHGIRGKYAHVGATTEELHRERQADKEREER